MTGPAPHPPAPPTRPGPKAAAAPEHPLRQRLFRRRRVPVRLQSTAVECGVACLAMVLAHFGRHVAIGELRTCMAVGRDGATAGGIVREARRQGLQVRAFRATPQAVAELTGPLIAHWGMNHFVVVERFRRDGRVDLVDPAAGRRTVTAAEFDALFTGVVLQATPTDELERRAGGGLGLWSFVRPFVPRRAGVLTAIVGASLTLTLLGLLPALLTGYLVDRVIPGGAGSVLTVLAIGLGGYAVGHALTTLARSELLLWLQTRIDASMMSGFVRHLVSLPYQFFQLRRGGDLLQRVSSTAYVRDVVSSQLLAVALDTVLLSVYLIVIGVQSWVHVALLLLVAGLQLTVMVVAARRAQRLTERELQAMSEAQSALLETVAGAETVKATGTEQLAVDRWSARYDEQLSASVRRRRLDNGMDALLTVLRVATPLLMITVGAALVLAGSLTLGTMLALNTLAGAALAPLGTLGGNLKSLQTVRVHLDRLRDVFAERPEADGQGDARPTLRGGITLDAVTFAYGDGPPVLQDIDLRIAPGERIAIVGPSGSGKSTLSRLLLGLYQPSSGMISFDDTPLQELALDGLRAQCGVVTQDPHLFSGSLVANIALARPSATLDEISAAAAAAAIDDDIAAMPMGYETVLGDGGLGLSGGQQQRVAIARALVTEPRILLLDEATSHLDAVTEARVHANLSERAGTRIVIAHRLSTVRDADRIIVLADGRIAESGRHDELVAAGGAYAELVAHQLA